MRITLKQFALSQPDECWIDLSPHYLYPEIQKQKPELNDSEAWELATSSIPDTLNALCGLGFIYIDSYFDGDVTIHQLVKHEIYLKFYSTKAFLEHQIIH